MENEKEKKKPEEQTESKSKLSFFKWSSKRKDTLDSSDEQSSKGSKIGSKGRRIC